MRLTIRQCEEIGDWWIIERHEEPGEHREWMERREFGFAFQHSARFSDADVEGTSFEMLSIATAIENRGWASFKRCQVNASGDVAYFESPRNSSRAGEVPIEDALALAALIRERLGTTSTEAAPGADG